MKDELRQLTLFSEFSDEQLMSEVKAGVTWFPGHVENRSG
jgi:hypothetical protein